MPAHPASLGPPAMLRSVRVVRITVTPFHYNTVADEIEVFDKIRLHVRMVSPHKKPRPARVPPLSYTYDKFYRAVVINYVPGDWHRNGEPENYLVVAPDEYESRLQGFIAWKEEQGYRVELLLTSELPMYPQTPDSALAQIAGQCVDPRSMHALSTRKCEPLTGDLQTEFEHVLHSTLPDAGGTLQCFGEGWVRGWVVALCVHGAFQLE